MTMWKRTKKILLMAVLFWTAFLMTETEPVKAATINIGVSEITGGVLNKEDDEGAGGIGVDGSSGVKELDNAAKRTNSLINWICGWFGAVVALFGFIWAAMNQAGHNVESRNMGIIVSVVGIVIAFAPKIVNFILGK